MKNKYLRVYESLTNDVVELGDPRREAIIKEMKSIERAKTNREAADVINWWHWNSDQQLISFVVRARKALRT